MNRTNENGLPTWKLTSLFDKALYVFGCISAAYLVLRFAIGFVQGFAAAV